METPEKVFRAAIPSELMSAIDETPALIVPVVVSFAVLEAIPLDATPLADVNPTSLHLFRACLGALIGVVFYSWGNWWDENEFDPRYGPGGTWISSQPNLGFPSASDLDKHRAAAARILPGIRWFVVNGPQKPHKYLGPSSLQDRWLESTTGAMSFETENKAKTEAEKVHGLVQPEGVYVEAEEAVRAAGRWRDVQGSLVISKFVRSFIWPVLVAAAFMGVLAVFDLFTVGYGRAAANGAVAVICVAVALLSFMPYFHFRVKHMTRLYRLAERVAQR